MFLGRIIALAWILMTSAALAQPVTGSLIGQVDGDPMNYECGIPDASGKITCNFIQVLLSPAAIEEDLQASLAEIPAILGADSDDFIEGSCSETTSAMKDALSRFEAGQPSADGVAPPSDPRDLEHLRRWVQLTDTLCRERTAANLEALMRFAHDRSSKTCRPFINQFSQTFVQVSEAMWVAESSPTGPCGILQASRFTLPDNGLQFLWEYTSQKIVTNPAGSVAEGFACSELDQSTILYTWNSGPQRIDCEFID